MRSRGRIEALLVVASQPLTVPELAEAAATTPERVETALGLLGERFREGRSGIVLEQVAGGWAFRASREAAEACGRLFERPGSATSPSRRSRRSPSSPTWARVRARKSRAGAALPSTRSSRASPNAG